MYEVIFKVPIYRYTIKLVLCEDVEKYVEDNGLYDTSEDGKCKAIVIDFEKFEEYEFNCMVIFTSKSVKGGLITHEIIHILHLIMKSRGFTLTDSSEECVAYLAEWLYKTLVFRLLELKLQINGNTNTSKEV